MRVLFVSPAAGLGGSERSLLDVLAALGEASPSLERTLLLLADGELAERARALDVSVAVLPMPEALESLGESRRGAKAKSRHGSRLGRAALEAFGYVRAFRQHALSLKPHLIHTNGMKAHLLAAAATPDIRRVVHFRDFPSGRPLTQHLLPLLGWRSIVVANSRAVELDLQRSARTLRTRLVYNGIDVAEFSPGPSEVSLAPLAGMAEPDPNTLNVGLVATYAWWKGHRRFLEMAAEVRAQSPARSLRFYVVGGPIYGTSGSEVSEAELRAIVRERGLERDVGFVPFQANAAAVYRGLDIVVHASERPEPFGRTIVEAMACGRAVVVASAGGAVELFADGDDAVGYAPDEPGALARAVLRLVNDDELRRRVGLTARAHAVERFDRRRLGPELLSVYGELLGNRVE